MPLPDDYLIYPNRKHGFDNPHYGWEPMDRRAKRLLISGAQAACFIVIPLEFFPLNPPASPFKHPGAMKTPYPDLRHFTVRDYGNRVGVYRLLRELEKTELKATFAVNSEIAQRYPPLLDAVRAAGHEIAAHGISTTHIHHDELSTEDERALITKTRATFPDAATWMSPARNQSYRTLDLLAEAGFQNCLDWEADQIPLAMTTSNGPVTALPLMNELGDFKLLVDRSQSEHEWSHQIIEAAHYCVSQHEREGAQCFGFTLTPYVAGQPFRIKAVRHILSALAAMDELDILTAAQIPTAFESTPS